ncbi:MAG TPA: sodium/solute symporter [Bryobacteraceae bacterium]|nr:sodium/solute symporter [Bryobacteraceae bacterium]
MSLSLTALDWIICLIALVGSIGFGLSLAVRRHSSDSSATYFLAGRSLTWPIVGASLYATNIGAEHLVGLSGDAYRYGLCAGTVELCTCIPLGIAAGFLFPYYLRNKVYTIPEFLEMRYNATARAFFSALMLVISIMTKMAFHLYAGALVLHGLIGWDIMEVVALMGAIAAVVTIIGGFTAVAYTDSIQTGIMILGCGLMLAVGLDKAGGWAGLAQKVPEAIHIAKPASDPNYPFWGIVAGAFYGGTFYWGMDQVNVQRVLGARDILQARWGAMFTVLLKVSPVFIFALPGVIALALFPGRDSKTTFITLLNELLPNGIRGLVLAALLASLIGSTLSVMNSVSTLVVRDFVLHFRPATSEPKQVLLGRMAIVMATVLGVIAAYLIYKTPDGLYKYLQTISIYLTIPVAPAIFFGIMSKRVTVQGAVASVLGGSILAMMFVWDQLIGESTGRRIFPWLHTEFTMNYTYRGLWGTLVVVGILFAVSAFTPRVNPGTLQRLTVDWSSAPEALRGFSDWRVQLTLLVVVTIVLYTWLW